MERVVLQDWGVLVEHWCKCSHPTITFHLFYFCVFGFFPPWRNIPLHFVESQICGSVKNEWRVLFMYDCLLWVLARCFRQSNMLYLGYWLEGRLHLITYFLQRDFSQWLFDTWFCVRWWSPQRENCRGIHFLFVFCLFLLSFPMICFTFLDLNML